MRSIDPLTLSIALAAVSFAMGCGNQNAPPAAAPTPPPAVSPTPASTPTWTLTAADSDLLAPAIVLEGFQFRPPKDFKALRLNPNVAAYVFAGPPRPDETYTTMTMIFIDLPAHEPQNPLVQHFQTILAAIENKRENWHCDPISHGTINGHPFVRAANHGIAAGKARPGLLGKEIHNVAYLGIFGNRTVQILMEDVAPNHAEPLKLCELSVATLKLLPAKTP